MTIASEMIHMMNNVTNIYNKLDDVGATLPVNKNLDNIPNCIDSLPININYALGGSVLKKAEAWTYTDMSNVYWKIYNPFSNVYSSSFQALTISGLKYNSTVNADSAPSSSYVVIDGKLYSLSSSMTMTQQGTDTDWEDTNGAIFIKNHKAYNSQSNAQNNTSPIVTGTNFILSPYGQSNYYFIADGKLYYNNSWSDNTSGNWAYIYNWLGGTSYYCIGIKNNQLYALKSGSVVNLNINVNIESFDLASYLTNYIAYANEKTVYYRSFSYGSGTVGSSVSTHTFDYNVVKLSWGYYLTGTSTSNLYVLLENGDVYEISGSSKTLIMSNIDTYFTTCGSYWLGKNGKIYKYNGTEVATLQGKPYQKGLFFSPVTESTITEDVKYTIRYLDDVTEAFDSYASSSPSYSVTNATDYSITINNTNYARKTSDDNVFGFIPTDLSNHTFTDYDMIEAYLEAGQQQ